MHCHLILSWNSLVGIIILTQVLQNACVFTAGSIYNIILQYFYSLCLFSLKVMWPVQQHLEKKVSLKGQLLHTLFLPFGDKED